MSWREHFVAWARREEMATKIVPEIEFGPGGIGLKLVRPPSLATREVRDDRPTITPSREWLWASLAVAFAIMAVIIGS